MQEKRPKLKEKVLFLSHKHPQLVLVMQVDRQHIVGSTVVNYPPVYVRFNRGPFGGMLETDDADVVDFIRAKCKDSDSGIVEVKDRSTLKKVEPLHKVRQGAISTAGRDPEAPKEQETAAAPAAAKTP